MTTEGMTCRLAALNAEWAGLAPTRPAEVTAWGPWASGAASLAEVLDAVRAHPDEALGGLLGASASGDQLAGRVVVQAMLGKLVRMAACDRDHDLGDYLLAVWELVRTYPLAARPRSIAANLVLDTLKRVRRHGVATEAVLDCQEPGRRLHSPWRVGASVDAVLDAAVRLGLLDQPGRGLLEEVYLDHPGPRPAATRKRCSRLIHQLRAHAPELALAVG